MYLAYTVTSHCASFLVWGDDQTIEIAVIGTHLLGVCFCFFFNSSKSLAENYIYSNSF